MEKIRADSGQGLKRPAKKAIRITLIAAVIAVLLIGSVLAAGAYANITSTDGAIAAARRELGVWKDMGILTADIPLDGEYMTVTEFEAETGSEYWFFRNIPHHYCVKNYGGKYSSYIYMDTLSGKILSASISAKHDEDDIPEPGRELKTPGSDEVFYYYGNYDDIFDPDLTVGQLCSKLSDYWGYGGYALSPTVDEMYGINKEPPAEDSALTDCFEPYITVYFEGDQSGVPQYIQVSDLPGAVYLLIGIQGHAVG